MKTKTVKADYEGVIKAAKLIKSGGIAAFPTETVYGLGADIFNESACRKIFEVKDRPADKPLIAHIAHKGQIARLAVNISGKAQKLIEAFMPGPITVVLFRSDKINNTVSGGTETVGIRMPDNKAAQEFIDKCGGVVAGTSANLSGSPAPLSADEVLTAGGLDGKIPLILDGGACRVREPSTVIDMTKEPPVILRDGAVSKEEIEKIIGSVK